MNKNVHIQKQFSALGSIASMMTAAAPRAAVRRVFEMPGSDPRGFARAVVEKSASRARARQTHPGKRSKRARHYP